jgi:hypothetical protein
MGTYLIVAHQTVDSPQLLEQVQRLAAQDEAAEFVVLVPATPVVHLMHWEPGETEAVARARAARGRERLEAAGIRVADARVGDPSPVTAVGDALRRGERFDAVVLSTFPQGISRWLGLDMPRAIQGRYGIPVFHVVADPELAGAHRTGGPEGRGIIP